MNLSRNAATAEPTDVAVVRPHRRLGRYRWWISLLLFLITVNNYMDRQMLSIAAPVIAAEYSLRNTDIALIANAFLIAYTVGQLFAGVFVDRVGARVGLTVAVIMWSGMSFAMVLGRSVAQFAVIRFLLGFAESVNYPGGTKVCAEWFPTRERATAVGFFQSGSAIGAMLTPVIAASLIVYFGWRASFVLVALPGLLWIPLWLHYYQPVELSTRVSSDERDYILSQRSEQGTSAPRSKVRWNFFLKQRLVVAVALARFLEEPAGWFYFTWLPLYLRNYRDVSLISIGFLLLIPFFTLDIGKVGGGWVSSHLIKTGWSLDRARRVVMLVSALCMAASLPALLAPTALGFVLLISIATLGHGSWATTTQTIPGDIVAPRFVGTVYGITAFGGGIGSVIFMYVTGKLVDIYGSFTGPFVIAGILPLLAYGAFSVLAGEIKPVVFDSPNGETI